MAEMNRSMAESIIRDCDVYKSFPLTVWEIRQLAWAWLKLNAPDSPLLDVQPFAASLSKSRKSLKVVE
jgi:hypothetical protein